MFGKQFGKFLRCLNKWQYKYILCVIHNIEEAKQIQGFETQTISRFCVLRSDEGFGILVSVY